MPPKGRPKRSKPYDSDQRKSAGKANNDHEQEISHPDIVLPLPGSSTNAHHTESIMSNLDVQQPSTSGSAVLPVSRYEFLQLQKSMADMSSVLKSVMSSLQGGKSNEQTQSVPEHQLLCPPSVIVNQPSTPSIGRASPANVIMSQPTSIGRASPVIMSRPGTPTPSAMDRSVASMHPAPATPIQGTSIPVNVNVNLPIPGTDTAKSSPLRPIRFPINPDEAVQSAVNQHLSSIVNPGESYNNLKVSYQVDRRIPDKTLQLIWEDQYVDLSTLISKEVDPDAPLQLIQGKPGEPATWAPVKSNKFIENISQWSDLFDIYVAAYSRKHPNQTPNLMTHKFNVSQLAADGADFQFYDVEFRKAHAKYGIPWENPDMQLWVKAANKGIQSSLALAIGSSSSTVSNVATSSTQNFKSSNSSFRPNKVSSNGAGNKLRHPAGYCFHFHNKRCGKTNCRFLHQCWMPGCGEKHSVYKCPKLQNQSTKFVKQSNFSGAKGTSTPNANKL